MKVFTQLKYYLLPKKNKKSSSFSNQDLLDELSACFNQNLKDESFADTMLFPMSLKVFLHPGDYSNRKDAFPVVVRAAVNAFYDIIKQRSAVYPNVTNISTTWNFRFIESDSIIIEDDSIPIEMGEPHIMAHLFDRSSGNESSSANTKVTMKPRNSNVYESRTINMSVFSNMEILSETIFPIKFDDKLNKLSDIPVSQEEKNVLAELSYNYLNKINKFRMVDETITISGKNDIRKDSWVMKIQSETADTIDNGHVQIKFDSAQKSFSIVAFGNLRVNERNIPISKDGDITSVPLSRKAKLLIGGSQIVEFESKL